MCPLTASENVDEDRRWFSLKSRPFINPGRLRPVPPPLTAKDSDGLTGFQEKVEEFFLFTVDLLLCFNELYLCQESFSLPLEASQHRVRTDLWTSRAEPDQIFVIGLFFFLNRFYVRGSIHKESKEI